MIYERSNSVSIIKCVALQKFGQMCKLKENCSVGKRLIHWVKYINSLNNWGLGREISVE